MPRTSPDRSHQPPSLLSASDWTRLEGELDAQGFGLAPALLDAQACAGLIALYAEEARFRSRVIMARHGYGRGEYKYFAYPLPPSVQRLRAELYPPLARVANRWSERLRSDTRYPERHADFVAHCRAAGQTRPTPLLLRYGADDYNCLHQDLYGEQVFPFQLAILLSQPGEDFEGGEFVVTEQRPRMQSRASVVPLQRGDAVVFAVHQRPVQGTRGDYRTTLRHGVSKVRRGQRHTLGVIFHDAK